MTTRPPEDIQIIIIIIKKNINTIHQPKRHHKEGEINVRISITFFPLSIFPVNNGQSTGTKFHLLFWEIYVFYILSTVLKRKRKHANKRKKIWQNVNESGSNVSWYILVIRNRIQ